MVRFDCLLHVGDFGVWPDPARVDGATKRHDGAGDFLTEDGLASGQVITNIDPGQPGTGLRFIEPTEGDRPRVCPACGAEVREQVA